MSAYPHLDRAFFTQPFVAPARLTNYRNNAGDMPDATSVFWPGNRHAFGEQRVLHLILLRTPEPSGGHTEATADGMYFLYQAVRTKIDAAGVWRDAHKKYAQIEGCEMWAYKFAGEVFVPFAARPGPGAESFKKCAHITRNPQPPMTPGKPEHGTHQQGVYVDAGGKFRVD